MNRVDMTDFAEKSNRLRTYMKNNGYEFAVMARRDNFAWITGGGDNKIFRSSDVGFGILIIGINSIQFVAQTMDSGRIFDEELQGLDIETVELKWYEPSREETAMRLTSGGKVVSDIPLSGADFKMYDFVRLHFPLTDIDLQKYRKVGELCDSLLCNVAEQIQPGMTEHEIEARILYEYGKESMTPKVLLVGSDERIAKYRHPASSPKKVEKLVLIHAAADKWGLHANITRMVYFGDSLPGELKDKYNMLNLCEAQAIEMCRPGVQFQDILIERKKIFAEHGCLDEFDLHFPGATAGYFIGTAKPIIDNEIVVNRMAFDWFITVRGAKVEELSVSSPAGGELLSSSIEGKWPTNSYRWKDKSYDLPLIMMK